ncbi:MAG TPA: D-alanine--D-alanine ligase [Candidatus Agathobaculum stercoravium]|nr:D-alanine--D-alanine ligase [Candidatus Agathobaculum stercoravium]
MKLAVLFGGISSEHDISCLSAASILRNLDKTKYEIYPVGITQEGQWYYCPACDADRVENGEWERMADKVPALLPPDRSVHGLVLLRDGRTETIRLDCVFPVLHGAGGEDGTVQGLLELAGIPYVGCGVAACANSMDKSITKALIEPTGVRQAKYYLALRYDFERNAEGVVRTAADQLGSFPVFVKPCSQGSSVGVAKANDMLELAAGLTEAFKLDDKVLVEEFIDGHEVECAVLGNRNPIASTVGEIAATQEFYTFDAKYKDESSKLYIPAQITPQQLETVRQNALRVYAALGCRGLSRVDFFVTYEGGEVVFNELNSIPGFTSISMYPKLFDYEGIHYPELLDRLVTLALEEHNG